MFSTLIVAFLAATSATAAVIRAEPLEARAGSAPISDSSDDAVAAQGHANVTIWAGAVVPNAPSGTFTDATGTFVVPKVSKPSQDNKFYGVATWVGISGSGSIIQTGVTSAIQTDGTHRNTGWCEYFNSRDKIVASVEVNGSSGKCTLKNLTKNKSASKTVATPSHGVANLKADWIVEDFEVGGNFVALADFEPIHFTDASATTSTNKRVGPQDGNALWMTTLDKTAYRAKAVVGSGTVTITHV